MLQYSQTYDVVVNGGGLIGLASALGLAQQNLTVALIETTEPEPISVLPSLRVCAINQASERMLRRLGVWDELDPQRLSAFKAMHVWEKDGLGNIRFDGHNLGQPNIGHIIENNCLQHALRQKVVENEHITIIRGQATNIGFGEREAWLTLDDLSHLSARLVVAADGAESWVRKQCRIPLVFWDYGHIAIVATIRTEIPHTACARQAFLAEGPLAFLPLSEPNMCSIVWSTNHKIGQELHACEVDAFNRRLTAAFDGRLGRCELVSERKVLPLKMRYARNFARHRMVLIGDAAHTIHPLAGQGVNLGFLDSAVLAQEVGRIAQLNKDIGLLPMLREFERWRKADAVKMISAMEVFKQFYHGVNPLKKLVRDVSMTVVNHTPDIKKHFLLHAMGNKGQLPDLCQLMDPFDRPFDDSMEPPQSD